MTVPASVSAGSRRLPISYCVIPSLSMFLIGLYFGQSIPPGVDLVVLQSGLIGVLAFLGLTCQSARSPVEAPTTAVVEPSPDSRPSWYVERRLDRHVIQPRVATHHFADRADRVSQAGSVDNRVGAGQTSIELGTR
jgi:hypothetical protein